MSKDPPYLLSLCRPDLIGKIAPDDGRAVVTAAASKGGADQARGDLPKIAAFEHEPFEPIVIQHTVDTVGRQHQQLSPAKDFFDDMYLGLRAGAAGRKKRRGEPLSADEQEAIGHWERLSTWRKTLAVGGFAVGTFGLGFTLGGLVFGRWRKA